VRRYPSGTHHANAVGFNGIVPANATSDLTVVFDGIPIM
jgi:hypothetical protein